MVQSLFFLNKRFSDGPSFYMYSLHSLGLDQFNTEAMFCHDAIIDSPASQFMLISAKLGVLSFMRATLTKYYMYINLKPMSL